MNKNMLKHIFIIFILLISAGVHANTQVPTNRIIKKIWTYQHLMVIEFSPSIPNDQGCLGSGAEYRVAIEFAGDAEKQIASVALSAYLAGKPVGFGIGGGCNSWGEGIPKIYRIDI